jgi:mannosylglycoprotein endo-beta-mannosidase
LATQFYVDLLGTAQPREFDLSLASVGLPPVDLAGLEAHFSADEVWEALRAMPTNKSPGPDGFTWEFYRCCWSVLRTDVIAALCAIWLGRDQDFDWLNEALITLLPKKEGTIDLKDFRPVSLVHSFARLLTKILARRLAPRMDELMDGNQTAFIRGRCIQDNFLLVQESAKRLHARREAAVLLKVDIAKAFDSLAWPFLLSVLRQRGFGTRWLRWITLLLRTARTRVLIKGSA